MQNVKIRLEGTQEKIQETLKRLRQVLTIVKESDLHNSRFNNDIKLCYLTVYLYDRSTLYEQLEALKLELNEAQERAGKLALENENLKEQLDLIPKPQPYDAVLGTPHTKNHNHV